ncbi:MAG: hypothetical protein J5525_13470 [Lachnospiraceae bacterium]|nr:hypothetical protein [Lachnospiraceae bacterium]
MQKEDIKRLFEKYQYGTRSPKGQILNDFPNETEQAINFIIDDGFDMTDWYLHEFVEHRDWLDFIFMNSKIKSQFSLFYEKKNNRWTACYDDCNACEHAALNIADAVNKFDCHWVFQKE